MKNTETQAGQTVPLDSTGSVPRWIKIKLRKAIHYIHNEDDYEKGMDLIAELAGIEINETGAVQTTVSKLLEQNNQRRLRSVHNT